MSDDRPRKPDPGKPADKDAELNIGSFAGLGLQFGIAIVVFLFLGQWLDRRLDTSPTFLIAGVFLGGGAAFYNMYRRLTAAQKADEERRKRDRESRGKAGGEG